MYQSKKIMILSFHNYYKFKIFNLIIILYIKNDKTFAFFYLLLTKKTAENTNILYINIFIILMSRIDPSNMLYILHIS